MGALKKHTIARPRMHKVVHLRPGEEDAEADSDSSSSADASSSSDSLILLDESTCPPGTPVAALPAAVGRALSASSSARLVTHRLVLGYDDLSAEEALSRLLPADVTVPTGFELAGTIAHLNLRPEHAPHKTRIARVLLDKLPQVRTVVNKVGETGGPHRTFEMEVLAGEGEGAGPDAPLETSARENGLTFRMDFRAVYWNSRLGTERARLVRSFAADDVVLDLCCGVGPIALLAARKVRAVYANDLNPRAVRYLELNERANFLRGPTSTGRIAGESDGGEDEGREDRRARGLLAGTTCMDARLCVAARVGAVNARFGGGAERARSDPESGGGDSAAGGGDDPAPLRFTQAVMNLPGGSVALLDAFVGAFDERAWPRETLPRIHAYAFSKDEDPEEDVARRVAEALGARAEGTTFRRVRMVAPGKYMMLASFPLPPEAAYRRQK